MQQLQILGNEDLIHVGLGGATLAENLIKVEGAQASTLN